MNIVSALCCKQSNKSTTAKYLAIKGSRQLSFNNHDNYSKHPTDQGVIAQLFSLPKESPPQTQPVANVLCLLLWDAVLRSDLVPATGLPGVLPDNFGKGVLEDGAVEKLLAGLKVQETRSQSAVAAEGAHHVSVYRADSF